MILQKNIFNNLKLYKNLFNKKGYVLLQNVLTPAEKMHLLKYTSEIENSSKIENNYIHKYELDSNNNSVLCRTEYIINNHAKMKHILTSGKLPNIIENIYGKSVLLYKEKINYKYPNTGAYKPHQDITAYPNSNNHITCLISLCNTNILNGCLQFSNVNKNEILEHKNGIIQNDLKWKNCPMNFGDIVLFNSYIPHKSGINKSKNPRKSLYITYNDAEEGDLREEYYENKKKTLHKQNKLSLIDHYDGNIINTSKTELVNNIIRLYEEKGHTYYDKNITQLEHSLQTAELAYKNNESEELQLSCFLHDIGHLLLDEHNDTNDFLEKDKHHETIGFSYINNMFSNKITRPVLLHVLAKRYLCTIDEKYYDNLSNPSKQSFKLQGGLLEKGKIKLLEKNEIFMDAVKIRRYEDESKRLNNKNLILDLNYMKKLLYNYSK